MDDSNDLRPTEKRNVKANDKNDTARFIKLNNHLGHLRFQPVPYDEDQDPDRFWERDPSDGILPQTKGWVNDVVYYFRGREVAKLFMIWSSLFCIASAVKREAWVNDADEQMFCNLYFLIVGESGSGKNTATDFAVKMLDYFESAVCDATTDINIPHFKYITPFTDSATRASLIERMMPENKRLPGGWVIQGPEGGPLLRPDAQPYKYYQTSEISIIQEEMGTFMNRQLFMEDLLPWLTKIYDPKSREGASTKGRVIELRNTLVNLMGNTTPVALKDTLPSGVQNDGFLSRTLLVYQDYSDHEFSRKRIPQGAPSTDELRRRLGWIAASTWGEWKFSAEAEEWYDEWYHEKHVEVRTSGIMAGLKSRHKVYVRKIATLLRWAEYDRSDNIVHLRNLQDASTILEYTVAAATPLYLILMDPKATDKTLKIEEALRRHGEMSRQQLVEYTRCSGEDVTFAVRRLYEAGAITVKRKVGEKMTAVEGPPQGLPREQYYWTGRRNKKLIELKANGTKRRVGQPHKKVDDGTMHEALQRLGGDV